MRIVVYTVDGPRVYDDVHAAETGPNGELVLRRDGVTFRIISDGYWDEVSIADAEPPARIETPEDMLKEFHAVFPAMDDNALRLKLLREEVQELADAMEEDDIVEIADGIADIVYVAVGTAIVKGIPFDEIFAEVHRSNMTKLEPDGKPRIRADGKILKGKNFKRPQLKPILKREGLIK